MHIIVSHVFISLIKGLSGEPNSKKPKLLRQSQDNSFDNLPSSALSVPSPVGSQMSNMSNPSKFIKMLGGRDRGRKPKLLKVHAHIPVTFFSFHNFTS